MKQHYNLSWWQHRSHLFGHRGLWCTQIPSVCTSFGVGVGCSHLTACCWIFSLLAAYVGEEAGEGSELGPEEDLHHREIGEETTAKAGCESSQESGCVPHFCKANVRSAPGAVSVAETEAARLSEQVEHGVPPVHQVCTPVWCPVHCLLSSMCRYSNQAILFQSILLLKIRGCKWLEF